ncbi:hypothetical protein [Streptomyces sp. MNU76]|uniref:hypothetical protein n=1 Tax=Streptomyces sp. MNU76 TaxID=2560026 RepID=UPI0035A925AA
MLLDAPLSRVPVLARGCRGSGPGADGGLELEVWAPVRGRTGRARGAGRGDGWDEPEVERYTARWEGPRLVVEREGDEGPVEPAYPVKVRGLDHG